MTRRRDEELIEACKHGDETAWTTIVERYQSLIFSVARRSGLNRDLASEIMQEVFFTLVQKLYEIEKPEYLKAWLVTTTRHKTIRMIEREKRGNVDYLDELEEEIVHEIPDTGLLADEVLTRLEKEQQMEIAVAALDERCNKLLTMLYYEDEVPYAKIAEILKIPLGSIGPTRARCLKKLMKFLPD